MYQVASDGRDTGEIGRCAALVKAGHGNIAREAPLHRIWRRAYCAARDDEPNTRIGIENREIKLTVAIEISSYAVQDTSS